MELTRAYYEAVRDCKPGDCGNCILLPETNRACHMVDIDPRDEAAFVLALMDERDRITQAAQALDQEVGRLRAWLKRIDGGDNPCTDQQKLRLWAYEAITLGHPCSEAHA